MANQFDTAMPVTVSIGTAKGKPREIPDYQSFWINRDIGQPDEAEIVFSDLKYDFSLADPVVISISNADGEDAIFIGEVVSIAATFGDADGRQATKVTAMNRLHRLNRGRRSKVFENNVSDKTIIEKVAEIAGITPPVQWSTDNFNSEHQHDVVHWTNQTPMEFLSMRAERYGYHIWCVDRVLHCKVPDLQKKSGFRLVYAQEESSGSDATMLSFLPRMSSADIVRQVKVIASNPVDGKPIEGASPREGKEPATKLGDKHAVSACGEHGQHETYLVDVPVLSIDEANAVADAEFLRRSLTYITAEAVVEGMSKLDLGMTVEVVLPETTDPFNGHYYVKGITHRWTVKDRKQSSHVSHLRLARDGRDPTD